MPVTTELLDSMPTGPGVYLMKDARGDVIYVGKAVNLRSRIRSYFREGGDGRYHTTFLRSRIEEIETILTDTEKEALLLENTLIKKHKPRYNIRLRDDKTYISLRLDLSHEWPRLHRTRRRIRSDRALYFGPYSSSAAVKETIRFLQRLFPLRSCSDRELVNRTRPCMLHQVDRCCAPCVFPVEKDVYQDYVAKTALFLRGRKEDVLRLLREKMLEYSDALQFEKAALVRDRLRAMEQTIEEEKVHSHRAFDRDVVAFARGGGRVVFSVHSYRAGRLEEQRTFRLRDANIEGDQALEDFLTQFYDGERSVPLDVLTPEAPSNREFLSSILAQQRGGPVHLRVPMRGRTRRLLEMVQQNAASVLEQELSGRQSLEETLASLRDALRLPKLPRLMECVDISNFQGAFCVGSLVRFRDGEPEKSGYRRFRIRGVQGQNDFAMLREVLGRQFRHADEGGAELPDLLVIDGGIGQLNAAVEALRVLGLLERIPIAGMAKSRLKEKVDAPSSAGKARTEERLFLPGRKNPVVFRRTDPALHVLQRLRDETHRFGIEYHRLLRSRSALKTGLEDIPGVGPKRRRALLRHFGSLTRLREASAADIASVPGVPEAVARQVHEFLHAPKDDGQSGEAPTGA